MAISFFSIFEINTDSCTMEEWLAEFSKRATAAEMDEPGTLAYKALTRADKPTHVMVYERYEDAAAQAVHRKHSTQAAFMKIISERQLTKHLVGQAFFRERAGFAFGAKLIPDPKSLMVTVFALRPQMETTGEQVLANFIKGEGLKRSTESEPGTVCCLAGVLDGAQRGDPPLEKGMFCLVEAYVDKRAFAVHLKGVMPNADPETVGFTIWESAPVGYLFRPTEAKL